MRSSFLGLALAALPAIAAAQQPAAPATDTGRAANDTLTRRPVMLQAVTITTTVPQHYEPASTERITAAQVRAAPATDAYDLLRQTAGLEIHEQGQGPGFASDASIRGFSSDHSTDIALWVDGVPINEPVNGHAEGYDDWNLLMPEAISAINVIDGPTSALYGNFAMAGAVNVQTLEQLDGTQFTASAGSNGHVEGALLGGLNGDEANAVLGIRGVHDDGWRPNSAYDIGQLHARLVAHASGSSTIDAGVELYGTSWESPGFLNDSLFALHRYALVENPSDGGFKRRAQERLSYRLIASPSLLWRSTAYATQGQWQLYLTIPAEPGAGEGTGSQTEEEDRRYGFGATSALTWLLPRGDVTAGVEGRWDHSQYQNWFTTDRHRDSAQTLVGARQASGALFAEASLDFTPHLRATLGARYDLQNTLDASVGAASASAGKGIVAPKLGLLYHIAEWGALYANASRGFRQTDGVITDPTLPFITEWAYETGFKLDRGPVAGTVALFRTDVSNEQTFDPITLASTSGGASRRRGVEVALTLRATDAVTLMTDWTFLDARYVRLITAGGDTLDGAPVYNTSRYVGVASASIALPGGLWRAAVSLNAAGPYSPFDEPGVVRPAYALVHASAAVRVAPGDELELGVRNLFNRAYAELEAGGYVAPGQTRSLYVTLRAAD
jgi:outer membrane receptor protein involved in Fe transport